jgi:hypothetical protein
MVGFAAVGRRVNGGVGFLVLESSAGEPGAGRQAAERYMLIFTLYLRPAPTLVSRMPKSPRTLSRVMPISASQTWNSTDLTSSTAFPDVPTCDYEGKYCSGTVMK